MVDDADGVCLLADVRVCRAGELAEREQLEQGLLEAADEHHPPVQAGEIGHCRIVAQKVGLSCHDSRTVPDSQVTEIGQALLDERLLLGGQRLPRDRFELRVEPLSELAGHVVWAA